ncbi:winged helix-turn-helix domain-containing protein [Millisia brevis]|uniref:winged helix-turn-helix domain-containing protein n=1 Tax=Millisia brevis TaxID=264148 RepID=UPI0034E1A2E4
MKVIDSAGPSGGGSAAPRVRELSRSQARRIAIAAQGLAAPRPTGPVTMRHIGSLLGRIGLLQIDSVNVVARAHLLPVFARLGPYDVALLDRASGRAPRRLVEYWAHEASFVPPWTRELLRWRMDRMADSGHVRRLRAEHPEVLAAVRSLLDERGPLTGREVHSLLEGSAVQRDHWGWNWTLAKQALEALFAVGEVTSAGRTRQFERRYDLTERVIPAEIRAGAPDNEADAVRELVQISLRGLGIGSVRCIADYFRLSMAAVRPALDDLVEAGIAQPVTVREWGPAYLDTAAAVPRSVSARALLAPFDPLVFERTRLERLFDMHYRIEIYTPAHKRVHGYYVLPFLLGEQLVGRVDLKADRAADALVVRSAFAQPDAPADTAEQLAYELAVLAGWLGLSEVTIAAEPVGGDLLGPLGAELHVAR